MEDRHISREVMQEFAYGKMDENKYISTLEHMSHCDECSRLYAEILEANLVKPPVEFKKKTLNKLKQYNHQQYVLDKKKAFNSYCFRVGFACAAAITLIFSVNTKTIEGIGLGLEKVQAVSEGIEKYIDTSKVMVNEYIKEKEKNYDKKEK